MDLHGAPPTDFNSDVATCRVGLVLPCPTVSCCVVSCLVLPCPTVSYRVVSCCVVLFCFCFCFCCVVSCRVVSCRVLHGKESSRSSSSSVHSLAHLALPMHFTSLLDRTTGFMLAPSRNNWKPLLRGWIHGGVTYRYQGAWVFPQPERIAYVAWGFSPFGRRKESPWVRVTHRWERGL